MVGSSNLMETFIIISQDLEDRQDNRIKSSKQLLFLFGRLEASFSYNFKVRDNFPFRDNGLELTPIYIDSVSFMGILGLKSGHLFRLILRPYSPYIYSSLIYCSFKLSTLDRREHVIAS